MQTKGNVWSSLKVDILETRRQFFIDVKASLMNGLIRSSGIRAKVVKGYSIIGKIRLLIDVWRIVRSISKYPEPTKENSDKPNVHALIDFWDNFEKFNTTRTILFLAVRKIHLCEMEHDDVYAERHDKFLRVILLAIEDGRYKLPPVSSPTAHWSDPEAKEELAIARMEYAIKGR